MAFAEVEAFLDTPVKRYSSGMYVRLAFAVAAHLEPEILIVDEVLAVGDAQFQSKCLGKMQDVSRGQGRSVLFVSHNMEAIQALCTKCVMLRQGSLQFDGETADAVDHYRRPPATGSDAGPSRNAGSTHIISVLARPGDGRGFALESGSPAEFVVKLNLIKDYDELLIGINIDSMNGRRVATMWSGFRQQGYSSTAGTHEFHCLVDRVDLVPGDYSITATLGDRQEGFDLVENAMTLTVIGRMPEGAIRSPNNEHGFWNPSYRWRAEGGTNEL